MANTSINTRVKNKHDTSTNWAKALNFIPLAGEIVVYDDLENIKIGDGTTKINDLNFVFHKSSVYVSDGMLYYEEVND